ncbi:cytochrome-c oxidase [Thermus thermamylovorans]|uniref:cytochrome-c oxidase n=1 Tax=Thermus thermamylovorans TaxID=2509362 RepID=A0A4Q9B529_9DEIN|nr:cytochrome-c oxidase [Thermus thermamylovorans]
MQRPLLVAALVLMVVGAIGLALLRPWWFAPLASNWGSIDQIILLSLLLTGLAYAAVNLFLAYCIHRYHKGPAEYIPEEPTLERRLIWITTLGIVVLLAPGLYFYAHLIRPPKEAHTVEVLSQQWLWNYRYPGPDGKLGRAEVRNASPANPFGLDLEDPAARDDIVVIGGPLRLPLGEPVLLLLRANDVLHSFYVPEFRVKMDAVPGMVTRIWFTPTEAGEFQVICAEFCGIGHARMLGQVLVLPPEEFRAWLHTQPGVAQTLGH